MMKTRRTRVHGVQLSLAEAGIGQGRRVLLLHGFCGAKEDFVEWLDRLAAEGWHAVAYDQRGHGDSGHPDREEDFSLSIFTDDLLAVVEELRWDRFVLLGHSMGGMIAQLFALRAPERLSGLILMDTSHGVPDRIDADLAAVGRQLVREGGMAALVAAQRALGPDALDTPASRRLVAGRPGYQEFCDGKTLAASPAMWASLSAEMFRQPDRLAELGWLPVPLLVVVGSQDEPFVGQCREMAAARPGSRLAVIPDAGHSPQFEQPDLWWAAVSEYLAAISDVPA